MYVYTQCYTYIYLYARVLTGSVGIQRRRSDIWGIPS